LEGIATRLFEVPVPAGNYSDLQVAAKHLLWVSRDTAFEEKRHLRQLEITSKDPKPKTLADGIRQLQLSADGRKILVRKGDVFHVVPADTAAPAKLEDKVNLEGWTFPLQPREEWRQIFTEAWRMMRDHFYDRGMHRVDWPATLRKYLPLVDRVTDRAELSDAISQMVGELSTLHLYVRGGDQRRGSDEIEPASLGARLSRDPAGGGWRVDHIYRADPDYPSELSPLARPGVDVRIGDVLLAINGRATLAVPDPSVLPPRWNTSRSSSPATRARSRPRPSTRTNRSARTEFPVRLGSTAGRGYAVLP
jgi:tricorn protease